MKYLPRYALPFLLLFLSLTLCAQELPTFKAAKEITQGTLANSVSYYIAKNSFSKGYADFALIQKGRSDVQGVRECLAKVPHFGNVKPYEFMARYGVGYSPRGYVYTVPAATVVRFQDVPVYDSAVCDSTLLLLFDIMDTYPAEQAVIVAGDVDVQRIEERMKMLSMMVSTRKKLGAEGDYRWSSVDTLTVSVRDNHTEHCASISARYSSPRTDKKMMNTPQPIVKQLFSDELAFILRNRVKAAFRSAGVPLADVRYRYSGTNISSNDEVYELTVFVSDSDVYRAAGLFGGLLSDVAREGCQKAEFIEAKESVAAAFRKESRDASISNRAYVDRCEAAFCYGASLASTADVYSFVAKRHLPVERELELFNNFASALLQRGKNLHLQISCPEAGVDIPSIRDLFLYCWDDTTSVTPIKTLRDTSIFNMPNRLKKVKLSSSVAEQISGGSLWTFSNGIRVVFKKVAGDAGAFDFSFLLKGGPSSVAGSSPQEQAYFDEMLPLWHVAGLSPEEFSSFLAVNGIGLKQDVTLSDMRFSGTAKTSSFQLLIKVLSAIADKREFVPEEYEYFKRTEVIRLELARQTQNGINSVMDSIISPDFHKFKYNSVEGLSDNLPVVADQYFESEFDKVNDGILVLVGDLNEEFVKQTLCKYLGAFGTSKRYSTRPQIRYALRRSWATMTSDTRTAMVGERSVGVNMALAAPKQYSPANTMAFKIALLALETEIDKALSSAGMYATVTGTAEMFPLERMTVYINTRPSNPAGLPEGVEVADPLEILALIRKAVTGAALKPVSSKELAAYKAALTAREESRNATREALVEAVQIRYSAGRDIVTGYKDAVKSVTQKDVQEILGELDNYCKVEYVIR